MFDINSIPFLGPIIQYISDKAMAAVFSHINYMFCSKSLVEDLKSEYEKLEIEESKLSKDADQESKNGKILEEYVVKWQKDVRENQEIVTKCLEKNKKQTTEQQDCPSYIRCLPVPHPISRYTLGKEAAKAADRTTKLADDRRERLADKIAYHPLKTDAEVTVFLKITSREKAYKELERQLVNGDENSSPILGIYGIAGAGKTRLMEQIAAEAVKKGTFARVVGATVGNKELDVRGIQEQLAGKLGCKLEHDSDVKNRAAQLRSSLTNGGKILIVLDDLWAAIDFNAIGILSEDGKHCIKGGKIILTSRDVDTCRLNNCEQPVEVKALESAEAWTMFSETVGDDKIKSLQDKSLAQDICERCGGLPLVILAVAKTLKLMPYISWSDARTQLINSKFEKVPGITEELCACLKWSFDNLKFDAKACLLLASMFPEDADIPILKLVQLAKGVQLATDSERMDCDESRVYSMIHTLRSASLLLEGKNKEHIKLHDIIRAIARSIAKKDHEFLFAKSRSLSDDLADCSGRKVLHIDVDEKSRLGFPSALDCPTLQTLSLRSDSSAWPRIELQEGAGQMFPNLTFLVLAQFLWPLNFSLESLSNLKRLWFDDCDLRHFGKTEVKFLPEKLESLCMSRCINPRPLNLPELNQLRRLEINPSNDLVIEPNAISRLTGLEELRLHSRNRSKSLLDEIGTLPGLRSLHIFSLITASTKLADIFPGLTEFRVLIGNTICSQNTNVPPVRMKKSIIVVGCVLVELCQTLIEKAEEVILCSTDFTGKTIQIRDAKEFNELRYMHIHDCRTMKYLATISPLVNIQRMQKEVAPFSKLVMLEIKNCIELEYLFCSSVAKCLGQLQKLHIINCHRMKEVVLGEGTSDEIVNFSELRILSLDGLPKLKSFYGDKDRIPSSPIPRLFGRMVAFPSLEVLHIRRSDGITDIWGDNYNDESSFSKLKTLSVKKCKNVVRVIPPTMLRSSLDSEVGTHGSNTDSATASTSVSRRIPNRTDKNSNDPSHISVEVLPQNARACLLDEMHLEELPSLENTGLNIEDQSGAVSLYPNLRILRIRECESLNSVFLPSPGRHFMDLEEMSVTNCNKMTEIIGAGNNGIEFHKLLSLVLTDLPVLTRFWECGEANSHKVEFPNLKSLELRCGEVTSLEMIELGRDDSKFRLEKLNISCDQEQLQIPDQWLPHLNNLESLTLIRCWSDKLKSLRFKRLKKLTLSQLSCSTIFSFPDFERLQQLQEIEITECDSLEHIVEVVRGEEASGVEMKTLLQLKTVILDGLPKLKSFLRTKSIISGGVEQVEVEPSVLLTCSVFGNLQKLEKLQVINCRLLESIVEVAEGPETSNTDDKIITFPQLSTIKLGDLPKLENFSPTASYSFKMPELKKVYLRGCPQVKKLTSLEIIITKGVFVYTERDQGGKYTREVNKYITQCQEQMELKKKSNVKKLMRMLTPRTQGLN